MSIPDSDYIISESDYVVGISRANRDDETKPSFDAAVENAYERTQAQSGSESDVRLRLIDTVVTGSNPISEYRVLMAVQR